MIVIVTFDDVELSDADNSNSSLSCAPTLPLATIDTALRRTDMGQYRPRSSTSTSTGYDADANTTDSSSVRNKRRLSLEAGMRDLHHWLPEDVTRSEAIALIDELAEDPSVSGVLIQLPFRLTSMQLH